MPIFVYHERKQGQCNHKHSQVCVQQDLNALIITEVDEQYSSHEQQNGREHPEESESLDIDVFSLFDMRIAIEVAILALDFDRISRHGLLRRELRTSVERDCELAVLERAFVLREQGLFDVAFESAIIAISFYGLIIIAWVSEISHYKSAR